MTAQNGTDGSVPGGAPEADPSPPDSQPPPYPSLQSPSGTDAPLPASHGAEGMPPPSWISSASNSFNSYIRTIPVPGYFQDAGVRVQEYAGSLPRSATQHIQYYVAAASSAVYDPEVEATATSFYFTPLPDCCSLDRLAFAPASGGEAAGHVAGQKTFAVGAFLAIAGFLMFLFPRLPTVALVLITGSSLVVAGLVTLASFVLTLANPGSYIFLLLAVFHLSAGSFLILRPRMGAFWLCFIIALWLIAKGMGRLSAWRSYHSLEAPSMWRVPSKSGLTYIVIGCLLVLGSRWPYLLGMIFGWDIFFSGILLSAAGLHSLRPPGGVTETAPLVHAEQPTAPTYTV